MSELLLRLFVPKGSPDDPVVRTRCGLLSGITGIILNIILVAGKLTVGIIAGSVAIIADAINNFSDAASSVITLAGFKLAGQKPDKEHPFGHGRIEYVAGLIVSVLIIFMGFELAWSSIEKIITPEAAEFSYAAMGVLIAAILVKFWLFYFNRKIAKRINSPSIAATASDSISDVIATGVVLAALIAGQYTTFPIDGVAGVIVAIFIFKAGWGAVKTTQAPLLGRPMSKELADAIDKLALEHENILGIHDLIYHDYGPGRAIVSFHAEVPADGNLMETHEMIDHVEREIREKFGIEAVIHMDPIVVDGDTEEMRTLVESVVKSIHPDASIHDLRIAEWDKIHNVYFDVIVPYGLDISDEEIEKRVKEQIKEKSGFNAVMHVEHPFIES
ncbi:MAG TPA: cation transporter [Candidatus Coproplasma stercorigallinarum]|nr:cation transporter [Candidatus Coproplasma stercorigallinarum]